MDRVIWSKDRKGNFGVTANRSETGSGHSVDVIAPRARIDDLGARPRTPSGPAVHAPRIQAGYMTAPDPLAEPPKPLAERGPSIHDVILPVMRAGRSPARRRPRKQAKRNAQRAAGNLNPIVK